MRDHFVGLEEAPDVELSLKSSRVRRVERALAEQIILKYEWLGTMTKTSHHYGIFFDEHCAGVCCIVVGSGTGGTNVHMPFEIPRQSLAVLARGACVHWAPPNANSRLVSWSCRLLIEDRPGVKLVLAYADSDAGECGTIYQASNWYYIGQGNATLQWVSPKGRVMDARLPSELAQRHGGERRHFVRLLRERGWYQQRSNPKHRYCQILDKSDRELVARVGAMSGPYPKRAGSIDSDVLSSQGREGGASPTPALQ